MKGFVDTAVDSFKQTLSRPLWLYFLIVQLIEILVEGFALMVFVFSVFFMVFGPISSQVLQNIGSSFASPELFRPFVFALGLFFLVFVLLMIYLASVFKGVRFNLFNDFAEKKTLDLGKAFSKTMPRVFVFFKINLVVLSVLLLLIAVATLPVLSIVFSLSSLSQGQAAGNVAMLLLYVFLIFLFFSLAGFLLSPITALLAPVAFFEDKGVWDSFRRAYSLMKPNYLGNLAFLLVYFVILVGINLAVSLVTRSFAFFTLMPAFSSMGEAQTANAFGALFVSLLLYALISLLIIIPYAIWATVFQTASFSNLFFLDKSFLNPVKKSRVKHYGHRPKRKTK